MPKRKSIEKSKKIKDKHIFKIIQNRKKKALQIIPEKTPIIFIGVNDIIIQSNVGKKCPKMVLNCEYFAKKRIYFDPKHIAAIKKWSKKAEIRWLSKWGQHAHDVIGPAFGFDDFKVSNLTSEVFKNPQHISSEDLERPMLFMTDFKRWFNNDAKKIFKNKVCSLSNINIKAVNEFLEICFLTSYTFHVTIVELIDGNLRKCQENPYSQDFPVVDMTITQDFKEYDEFFAMIFQDPKMLPFIEHLKSDFNAIVAHCWTESCIAWRINLNAKKMIDEYNVYSIIHKLKESGDRLLIRFPAVQSMPKQIYQKRINSILPIIWLDVDGVINADPISQLSFIEEFPDCKQQKILNYPIMWSPTVVSCINRWSQIAEIRWLTTWFHQARYILAPIIGLNDFEVCSFWKHNACFAENHKLDDLKRPLLWIDDEDVNEEVKKIIQNEALLVKPNHFLSRANIVTIDEFLLKH